LARFHRKTDVEELPPRISGHGASPLFFVLLRGATAIGDSRLIYRLVSIFSGSARYSSWAGLPQIDRFRPHAVLAAFVFGISEATLLVALEVRSYTMCVFFALAAFTYYLDIVSLETVEHDWKARVGFSVNATLAILSHYSALISSPRAWPPRFCSRREIRNTAADSSHSFETGRSRTC